MANPKATKLPSGNYRCMVRLKGLPVKSFTGPNKREVEREALCYKATNGGGASRENKNTVGAAYDAYIKIVDGVLSPSTIAGYKRLRKNTMQSIMGIRLDKLTEDDVQRAVNDMVQSGASPKYVRNAHGLLSAVLKRYAPDVRLNTKLPQRNKIRYTIPSEAEIAKLQEAVRGEEIEIPVLLAAGCGLRMSEVRGLQWEDIDGAKLHISRVIVDTADGPVEKSVPKSEAGDRFVPLTPRLKELLADHGPEGEKIVKLSASAITGRLDTIMRKAELPHFKFHELRHSYASVMLAIKIPNKYAAAVMGHKSTYMLDKVYQQLMDEYADDYGNKIADYYDSLDKKCTRNAHEI